GEPATTAAIVGQDRMRDDGRRRIAAVAVDHDVDSVRGEDFDRAGERRLGQRMRIHPQEERTIDPALYAKPADRLRYREDVRFVERPSERRTPVTRSPE